MRIDNSVYYVLKDRLGSAYAMTDASGNVVGEMRYYASGETRLSTGNMFTDKLLTGQREMAGLGIYQFGARFYSPELMRFLSADPMGQNLAVPQAFNRYSYALNNPIRYTDPTGYWIDEGCGTGGGGSGTGCNLPPATSDPWSGVSGGASGGGDSGGGGGFMIEVPSWLNIPDWVAYAAIQYYLTAWKWDAWLYQNIPSAIGFITPSISLSGGVLTVEGTETTLINSRSMQINSYTTLEGGGGN